MEPHQQRVIDEKDQLDEKLAKLKIFRAGKIFSGLPITEQDRLTRQHNIMVLYSEVLGERIAAF